MKKRILFFFLFFSILTLTGCADMMNTPSKRVEEFLGKYQTMDSDVLTDLNAVVDNTDEYSEEGKEEYKNLMIKQYQNLSYKIKNEETNGDQAVVEVEIEVFDYQSAREKSLDYIKDHEEEFQAEGNKTSAEKKEEYQFKQLKSVTDKAYYTITFYLTKDNKKWILNPISDTDLAKIHGLYPSV